MPRKHRVRYSPWGDHEQRRSWSEWEQQDMQPATYFKRVEVPWPKMLAGVCNRCHLRTVKVNDYDNDYTCILCGG